jgi:hypothetical protein
LANLAAQYLGVLLTAPAAGNVATSRETRVLEVRYIGATKDRNDGGERTAFGWVGGEWSAIFPESVLLSWFGDTAKEAGISPNITTFYAVLAVKRHATDAEIRTAYRRLARHNHPDVSKEPDAHERFIRIQRAYEVLKDPRLRARYDAGLQLEEAAKVTERLSPNWSATIDSYRPPLRCGLLLVEGIEQLGRFMVETILSWEDIVDARGRTLVTSWPAGEDIFEEQWI